MAFHRAIGNNITYSEWYSSICDTVQCCIISCDAWILQAHTHPSYTDIHTAINFVAMIKLSLLPPCRPGPDRACLSVSRYSTHSHQVSVSISRQTQTMASLMAHLLFSADLAWIRGNMCWRVSVPADLFPLTFDRLLSFVTHSCVDGLVLMLETA